MTLPADIAAQLAYLGRDVARYKDIANKEGVDFLRMLVGKLVESAALFDEWHPRLVQFAAQKRLAGPLPSTTAREALEAAMQRILQSAIENAERVPTVGRHTSVVFCVPLKYLPMLRKSWPAEVLNAIFLTPDELREFKAMCDAPESAQWWYAFQWWSIQTEIPATSMWFSHPKPKLPANVTPLFVTSGLQWGSLAGGERADLWTWDGAHEQFHSVIGDCSF